MGKRKRKGATSSVPPDHMSVREAAQKWGVSRQRVQQWITDGRVTSSHDEKTGRRFILKEATRPRPDLTDSQIKSLTRTLKEARRTPA